MTRLRVIAGFTTFALSPHLAFAKPTLKATEPVILPGKAAKFDFMATDPANDRILAAHKEAGTLSVFDLANGKPLAEVPVGHAQGVAVDEKSGTYFVGDDDEHRLVVVKGSTLEKVAEIQLPGPADAVEFDSKSGLVYVDEDEGKRIWVVDPQSKKIVNTVSIPGGPEVLAYDPDTNRIYQNIKDKDAMLVIRPETNQVEASWATLPAKGPHGLAIDRLHHRALVAGQNGKLVAIDLASGKVAASADIAPGTDQITYDEAKKRLYCASKGSISVVEVTDAGFKSQGNVSDPAGAHTITVDRKRHDVWISYANKEHSYLQKYEAPPLNEPAAESGSSGTR